MKEGAPAITFPMDSVHRERLSCPKEAEAVTTTQVDMFFDQLVDAPIKDERALMEFPFFRLQKQPRRTPLVYDDGHTIRSGLLSGYVEATRRDLAPTASWSASVRSCRAFRANGGRCKVHWRLLRVGFIARLQWTLQKPCHSSGTRTYLT